MIYWVHLTVSFLLSFLPPSVAYTLVNLFGPWLGLCWPAHYRRAWRNMARVLGPTASRAEVARRVRNVFRNYGRYMVDLVWLPRAPLGELERHVRVVGEQHIDEAMRRGKGLVLVTAHVGNWDLGGALLARRGYPVSVIVETLEPVRWNERVQRIRERLGMQAIPLESGVRDMIAALRNNGILGVLIDRPLAEDGVAVRFFDATTRVPEGAARLALRTGAGLAVATSVRQGGEIVAQVSPLIQIEPSGDRGRDVQELTQRAMDWLEGVIRQHPDQWFMFRNMWPREA